MKKKPQTPKQKLASEHNFNKMRVACAFSQLYPAIASGRLSEGNAFMLKMAQDLIRSVLKDWSHK